MPFGINNEDIQDPIKKKVLHDDWVHINSSTWPIHGCRFKFWLCIITL